MGKKFSEQEITDSVEKETNHEYKLIQIEEKSRDDGKRYMTIQHNVEGCGHIYTLDIYEFRKGKRRCGKCKGSRLNKHFAIGIEEIKEKTQLLTGGEYSFIDESYVNSKTKHLYKHIVCGTVFEKKWEKFREGQRCPKCTRKGMESVASRYVRDVLDILEIPYETEKRFEDCINPETNSTLPYDYYLPNIDTLIEIDGEQHERGSFSKYAHEDILKRDSIKDRYAEENGIELVRIPAKKWSQLSEILHDILSRELLKNLTLEEVKAIPHSTHPERISKDMQKIHNGEYALYDPFYFGVDRKHNYTHLACGAVFNKTLSTIRQEEIPCPICKRKVREKRQHDTCNAKLIEKSKGRYSLDPSHIGRTKEQKRLVHCHQCHKSWYSLTGNIMQDNGGCPTCLQIKIDAEWKEKYDLVVMTINSNGKLNNKLTKWLRWNQKKYKEGKLKTDQAKLLRSATLL